MIINVICVIVLRDEMSIHITPRLKISILSEMCADGIEHVCEFRYVHTVRAFIQIGVHAKAFTVSEIRICMRESASDFVFERGYETRERLSLNREPGSGI